MILRALLIVIAILIAAVAVQTVRLNIAQSRLAAIQGEYAQAQVEAVIRGALSATDALENYVERQNKDAPVVERVVERVRNVCLRPSDRLPVPSGAGPIVAATQRAGNDEDRTFAVAIERDIRYCAEQLNILRGLQQFCITNGCGERPQQERRR